MANKTQAIPQAASFASLTPAVTTRIAKHLRADSPLYNLHGDSHGELCNCYLLDPTNFHANPDAYIAPALNLGCVAKKLRIQLFEGAERTYVARDTDRDLEVTKRRRQVVRESVK
jgi:hypothetical protein